MIHARPRRDDEVNRDHPQIDDKATWHPDLENERNARLAAEQARQAADRDRQSAEQARLEAENRAEMARAEKDRYRDMLLEAGLLDETDAGNQE